MSKSASGINDLALQRIRRKKPDVTAELFRNLNESLFQFRNSSRFLFFQNMTVREFFGPDSDADDALQSLTFAELIRLGSEGLCNLPTAGAADLDRLITILTQLLEGSGEAMESESEETASDIAALIEATPESFLERIDDSATDDSSIRLYGSVEAEARLTNGFERIRAAARRTEIEPRKVNQFWDVTLGRAPFLEALTFRELLSLRVDDILKKRSFGNRKLHGLLQAMSSCLMAYGEEGLENFILDALAMDPEEFVEVVDAGSEASSTVEPEARVSKLSVAALPENLPPFVHLAFRGLLDFIESDSSCPERIRRVGRGLLNAAPPEAFLRELLSEADGVEPSQISQAGLESELVIQIVERETEELLTSWRNLLAAAAVSEETLFSDMPSEPVAAALQESIYRLILRSLGAEQPCDSKGEVLPRCWTCNARAFEVLVDSILKRLPLSDKDLRSDLAALLPHVQVESVLEYLQPRLQHSQDADEWNLAD